jgi:hypothetical protein
MTQWICIDACGLEPPMPMVRILEVLAKLPSDGGAVASTDRQPMTERRGTTSVSTLGLPNAIP